MTMLYLVRGLPGSGKSTFVRKMTLPGNHYESDMYFMKNGEYVFDASKLGEAHRWCQDSVRSHLKNGMDAWVSNTFTQVKELRPYVDMARELNVPFTILTMNGSYGSIHGVPEEAMIRMKNRFVHDISELFAV